MHRFHKSHDKTVKFLQQKSLTGGHPCLLKQNWIATIALLLVTQTVTPNVELHSMVIINFTTLIKQISYM